MNDLLKMSYAVDQSEEWRRTVEMACALKGVPYSRDVLVQVTRDRVDDLAVEGGVVTINADDGDVIQAVEQYQPPEPTVTEWEQRLAAMEEILPRLTRMEEEVFTLQRAVDDQEADPAPGKPGIGKLEGGGLNRGD